MKSMWVRNGIDLIYAMVDVKVTMGGLVNIPILGYSTRAKMADTEYATNFVPKGCTRLSDMTAYSKRAAVADLFQSKFHGELRWYE